MNPRENYLHYIGLNEKEEKEILQILGLNSLDELFSHIEEDQKIHNLDLPPALSHKEIKTKLQALANKNKKCISFIGDGLQDFTIPSLIPRICSIRGLTTAYTPYQPERSQGTLQSLWIYQSAMAQLTGFEAINASLYERSTALFEALSCALRIQKKKNKVIVAENIYPGDIDVINTIAKETELEIIYAPIDPKTSKLDSEKLKSLLKDNDVALLAFAQINSFGQIEDVDSLTNLAHEHQALVCGMIEPISLANNGLKEPVAWGDQGANIIIGEAQHLTLAPNYGGPGLGLFGVRFNDENKLHVRNTAGRYIGKTVDDYGNECKAIILSTREQHIRREKATSNICSNQSFIATACGAALLNRGDKGLEQMFDKAHKAARMATQELTKFEGVKLQFKGEFFNEIVLSFDKVDVDELIQMASEVNLHIGVNISGRAGIDKNMLLLSFSDKHGLREINELVQFFKDHFKAKSISATMADIKDNQKRKSAFTIPQFSENEIVEYYQKLGNQNLSPDDGIYPLGSCTMKYNPEINDWAAGLEGFTDTHPQAPLSDVQGNLEVLFEIQEWFKKITGLPALTTQPVAGAQGELVGLKLFQAYHRDRGEGDTRNIVIIPRSAHGTNPATATMAGFVTKKVDGKNIGIHNISALPSGEMDIDQIKELVEEYGNSIAGIMVTNPNTAGIFETKFKEMSELMHSIGALVYMDGANMNAIAGRVDLNALGVDAVHNNLHKTWSIPHGGGGPGDAIVAVSERLIDYLPGHQVIKDGDKFSMVKAPKSIGSFHRHHGNFAHKVRAYTYLLALGGEGIRRMSAVAVLSARYLYDKLNKIYPILPSESLGTPRMHEFILTLSPEMFDKLQKAGTPKSAAIARVGKLFLDFGFHAPTVAFPEQYGLMLEPTESFTKAELDGFYQVVETIHQIIHEHPEVLTTVPHFTPIGRVNEVQANKQVQLSESIPSVLPEIKPDVVNADVLRNMSPKEIINTIVKTHSEQIID
jgi:glycine dehydrogenase